MGGGGDDRGGAGRIGCESELGAASSGRGADAGGDGEDSRLLLPRGEQASTERNPAGEFCPDRPDDGPEAREAGSGNEPGGVEVCRGGHVPDQWQAQCTSGVSPRGAVAVDL